MAHELCAEALRLATLLTEHRATATGEAHALDGDEFERLLSFAVARVSGRVAVLAGTGTANTRKTVAGTRRAQARGAKAPWRSIMRMAAGQMSPTPRSSSGQRRRIRA